MQQAKRETEMPVEGRAGAGRRAGGKVERGMWHVADHLQCEMDAIEGRRWLLCETLALHTKWERGTARQLIDK